MLPKDGTGLKIPNSCKGVAAGISYYILQVIQMVPVIDWHHLIVSTARKLYSVANHMFRRD